MHFVYIAILGWVGSWAEANQDVSMENKSCYRHVSALPNGAFFESDDPRLLAERLVVILKSRRQLVLFEQGVQYQNNGIAGCWQVALGVGAQTGVYVSGHKQKEGDRKTPEGWYRTSDKPTSQFYKAIAIHYPNLDDARAGLARGAITREEFVQIKHRLEDGEKPNQNTSLGGEILIHGGGSASDWTLGCIGMDNHDLDALRSVLPSQMNVDVLILP